MPTPGTDTCSKVGKSYLRSSRPPRSVRVEICFVQVAHGLATVCMMFGSFTVLPSAQYRQVIVSVLHL